MSERPVFSLIVPVFNEQAVLPIFFEAIAPVIDALDESVEVLVVDDGSRDASARLVEEQISRDPRYRLAKLSRNFGQQIAITAGLDLAQGRAVIIMDADLQDPPEVIHALVSRWREGFDVVCARRATRRGEGALKIIPAKLFYGLIGRIAHIHIPPDVGDFRLVDRKVVDVVRRMPERERFVRGLFSWAGFRHGYVDFDRPVRAAGEPKYGFVQLAGVAMNAVIGFSDVPLRLALWFGFAVSAGAMLFGLFVVVHWLVASTSLPGWSSTVFLTTFLCGSNMLMTGIMGLYIGRIYAEVKGRPLYVLEQVTGVEASVGTAGTDARSRLEILRAELRSASNRRAS